MPIIDILTLLIVITTTSLLFGVILLSFSLIYKASLPGINLIACGFILFAVALYFDAIQESMNPVLAISISFPSLVFSWYIMYKGVSRFSNFQVLHFKYDLVFILISLAGGGYFIDNYFYRTIFSSSFIFVYSVFIYLIFRQKQKQNKAPLNVLTGMLFLIFGVLNLLRLLTLNATDTQSGLVHANTMQAYSVLVIFLFETLLYILFLLILASDLLIKKDLFISILTHELKNSFHQILGYSSLMNEDNDNLPPDKKEFALQIENSASSGYFLLSNLLEWLVKGGNAKEFYKPEILNLNSLLEEVTENLKPSIRMKNISFNRSFEKEYICNGDKNMIQFVLRNLISNAVKFTPTNGYVSAEIEENEKSVLISIIDSGIGMTPAQIKRVVNSEKLNSTLGTNNEAGTGIGLRLSQDFVKLHKGTVAVKSSPETGSRFTFSISKSL